MKIYKISYALAPEPQELTTGKYSHKKYRCSNCGHETSWGTNHWGEFYNTQCPKCRKYVTWKCMEKPPEGYGIPEPWKTVNLEVGNKDGWMKTAQVGQKVTDYADLERKLEEAYFKGWDARIEYREGKHMILNPELRNSPIGRAFLRGWNDESPHNPRQVPLDLMDFSKSDKWIPIK